MSKLRRDWLTAPQVLRRPQRQQQGKNFFQREQRQHLKWQQQRRQQTPTQSGNESRTT
jgi:hypothetical protein